MLLLLLLLLLLLTPCYIRLCYLFLQAPLLGNNNRSSSSTPVAFSSMAAYKQQQKSMLTAYTALESAAVQLMLISTCSNLTAATVNICCCSSCCCYCAHILSVGLGVTAHAACSSQQAYTNSSCEALCRRMSAVRQQKAVFDCNSHCWMCVCDVVRDYTHIQHNSLSARAAHLEHQEVWVGPSVRSSYLEFRIRLKRFCYNLLQGCGLSLCSAAVELSTLLHPTRAITWPSFTKPATAYQTTNKTYTVFVGVQALRHAQQAVHSQGGTLFFHSMPGLWSGC
jgi:hypothetical protein